jgi:thiamine-phosphate pyrophosphorylase
VALAKFPPLYPILDAAFLPQDPPPRREKLAELVAALAEAGVEILQYRNKQGDEAEILRDAETIRNSAPAKLTLILNDYARLVGETGFHGLHLGQTDLPPHEARDLLGPAALIGLSTHNEVQLRAAMLEPVDYIAIGPVFSTASKANPDPVVGLDGVRLARRMTTLPVVAIGGITLDNAPRVWAAGADSIALISAIFAKDVDAAKSAAAFVRAFSGTSHGSPLKEEPRLL